MAIRFVDRRAHLGRIQPQLDGASSLLQGTHVAPVGRTGVMTSQFGGVTSSIVGGVTASSNRTGTIASTLGGATCFLAGTHVAPVQNSILFRANFANPNANGSGLYNFFTKDPSNVSNIGDGVTNWQMDHMPTGGYLGAPCVRFRQLATRYQYPMTFTTPGFNVAWAMGVPGRDRIFYRWRIRIEEGSRFSNSASGGKFIDHGNTDAASRTIVWMSAPYGVGGGSGTLGWYGAADQYGRALGTTDPRSIPSYFGLPGGGGESGWVNSPNTQGYYGSQQPSRGTGSKASSPALITAADNPTQPAPGPNSAPPINGWYWGQAMVVLGNTPYQAVGEPPPANLAPSSDYVIWLNNNSYSLPTARQFNWNPAGESAPITGVSWNDGVHVGNYVGGGSGSPPTSDFVWRMDKFEVALTHDPTWFGS